MPCTHAKTTALVRPSGDNVLVGLVGHAQPYGALKGTEALSQAVQNRRNLEIKWGHLQAMAARLSGSWTCGGLSSRFARSLRVVTVKPRQPRRQVAAGITARWGRSKRHRPHQQQVRLVVYQDIAR